MKCQTSDQINNIFGQGLIADLVGVCYVAQGGFKFVVLLPLLSECWEKYLEKLKVLDKYCFYSKALKLCNDGACPLVNRISVNVAWNKR